MFVTRDSIRARFSAAMSAMYRQEVPLYGDLLELVADVNAHASSAGMAELPRVAVERHGAVRLGTPQELATLRRVLAVMGMLPVGYYDLSPAGLPVHATAFRPVEAGALAASPFRLFTSLLRPQLIADAALRDRALDILARRRIFSDRLLELVERDAAQGGLNEDEAGEFVAELLETFRWHVQSPVTQVEYRRMHDAHRLVADIVCFRGPHINHLTPRTLDIDAAQREMQSRGIPAKAGIEGPPPRRHPILLRQTSFKALEEAVEFAGGEGSDTGTHTARFGEIEQRGQALTPRGRALYDRLLAQGQESKDLAHAFAAFPDDLLELRRQGLAYFLYRLTAQGRREVERGAQPEDIQSWVDAGWAEAEPLTYEDFLPVSAAGIFRSNLGETPASAAEHAAAAGPDRAGFERALGAPVLDAFELYEAQQAQSIASCRKVQGTPAVAQGAAA